MTDKKNDDARARRPNETEEAYGKRRMAELNAASEAVAETKTLRRAYTVMQALRHRLDNMEKAVLMVPEITAGTASNPHKRTRKEVELLLAANLLDDLRAIAQVTKSSIASIALLGMEETGGPGRSATPSIADVIAALGIRL